MGRSAEGLRAIRAAVRLDPRLEAEREFVEAHLGRDARQSPTATVGATTVRPRAGG